MPGSCVFLQTLLLSCADACQRLSTCLPSVRGLEGYLRSHSLCRPRSHERLPLPRVNPHKGGSVDLLPEAVLRIAEVADSVSILLQITRRPRLLHVICTIRKRLAALP